MLLNKSNRNIRLVKSIQSKTTHIFKNKGVHLFYGNGVFTMCNKHLRTETFTPEQIDRKCKVCFREK